RAATPLPNRITPDLLTWPRFLGTAVGLNAAGEPDVVVFVDRNGPSRPEAIQAVLLQLMSIPVRTELSDKIIAYKGRPGGGGSGTSHTALQAAPIQLGTSGGWRYDLANGYCCGGTHGSLIQVNGIQYIISNY